MFGVGVGPLPMRPQAMKSADAWSLHPILKRLRAISVFCWMAR